MMSEPAGGFSLIAICLSELVDVEEFGSLVM
jgi:hypothetical protein